MLIDAYKTNYVEYNDDIGVLWRRGGYLYGAIIQYNSFYDYIFGMLYFHLGLYEHYSKSKNDYLTKGITSKNDVISISQEVTGGIINKIDNYLKQSDDQLLSQLAQDLMDYNTKATHLRDLANDIKHRAGLGIEGIYIERKGFPIENASGTEISPNEIVKPYIIDIENEILYLKDIHCMLLSLQKKLHEILELPKLA